MEQSKPSPAAPVTTPTPATAPAVTPVAAPFDLDALLDAELPLPPPGSKGHSVDPKAALAGLTPDALKTIANLRDDYRAKTTKLADEKRNLESDRAAWLASQEATLKEKAGIPEDIDLFSSDGLAKFVQAKVAQAMLDAQQPLRQQQATNARNQEMVAFKQAHPDIVDHQVRIVALLSGKQAATPEQAYWMAKGEAAQALQDENNRLRSEQAEAARGTLNKFGVGATPHPSAAGKEVLPKDAYERYLYFKNKQS